MKFSSKASYIAGASLLAVITVSSVASSVYSLKKNNTPAIVQKVSPVAAIASPSFSSQPDWQQNFTDKPNGQLDPAVWHFEIGNNDGWGNEEVQNYTDSQDNVRVEGGNLVIEAKKTGSTYTSARITSEGSLDFVYGKIDIVAKLPTGKGIWPALWFWPTDDKYSAEPVKRSERDMTWLNNGELDLIEGTAQGDSDFSGSMHSLGNYPGHGERTGVVTVKNPSSVYHTYSMEWTPSTMKYLVDGKAFKTVTNNGSGFRSWPYDQRYHLIMNIAMGGTQSQNLITRTRPFGIDDKSSPWQLKVQSISYYPYVQN